MFNDVADLLEPVDVPLLLALIVGDDLEGRNRERGAGGVSGTSEQWEPASGETRGDQDRAFLRLLLIESWKLLVHVRAEHSTLAAIYTLTQSAGRGRKIARASPLAGETAALLRKGKAQGTPLFTRVQV